MEDQKQVMQQAMAEVAWILLNVLKRYRVGEMAQNEIKDLSEKLQQEKTKRLASDLASNFHNR